jgi:hypothetical protein
MKTINLALDEQSLNIVLMAINEAPMPRSVSTQLLQNIQGQIAVQTAAPDDDSERVKTYAESAAIREPVQPSPPPDMPVEPKAAPPSE